MALRGRWEQGAHLESKVPDMCADLMAIRGRWEQGAHLGSKVPDLCGQPTLWPFEADGSKVPISRPTLWPFEADGNMVPILGVRRPIARSSDHMALGGQWDGRGPSGGEGPLPVDPHQFVPDLRVDEACEELICNGLIGTYELGEAAGVFHLLHGLLLGLLRFLSPALGCGELLLQLLDLDHGRGDLLLEWSDLLLSDTL
nr:hypothetical protein Iba_chr04fCG11830 [Ipomoea batatas]